MEVVPYFVVPYQIADFWKEAHILGQLRHPNIVALYGVVADGPATNLATVTEFMINGSLKQVFRRKDRYNLMSLCHFPLVLYNCLNQCDALIIYLSLSFM